MSSRLHDLLEKRWAWITAEIETLWEVVGKMRLVTGPAGYVYLMRNEAGLHKIGFSIDPKLRMVAIQQSERGVVSLVCAIPTTDMRMLERHLHLQFAHVRVRGEWFNLSAADVEYLVRMSKRES